MNKLTTRQVGDVSIVDLAGRITIGVASEALRETLRGLMTRGRNKILVNLHEVSFIDSAGIGELVAAFKEVTEGGGQMKLVGLSGRVAYQLLATRSYTMGEMYMDEAAAIGSFG